MLVILMVVVQLEVIILLFKSERVKMRAPQLLDYMVLHQMMMVVSQIGVVMVLTYGLISGI